MSGSPFGAHIISSILVAIANDSALSSGLEFANPQALMTNEQKYEFGFTSS
eukprot:CAMPEP_0194053408 /NCGR_PEP_ID=MMETSP0009_2-20130614/49722_1 /TAXON_ID=210454 /ORGANISM="Grammatophora oceanica, Strain CCMP 410" /LENGTH=50 /DNA_ID=CAMNT_0038701485 /DNA_START=282 /DNA_END=430 /DNA_ORIENTATION=-